MKANPLAWMFLLLLAAAIQLPAQQSATNAAATNTDDILPSQRPRFVPSKQDVELGFVPDWAKDDTTNNAAQTQGFHAPASDIIIEVSPETRAKAERGDAEAQFSLAVSYYSSTNYTEAAKWYEKSAENGFAEAQTQTGLCYLYGNGVSLDTERAVKWFRKSAEQGDKGGQAMLGCCYGSGIGVPKNEIEAYKWLSLAAAHSWQDLSLGGEYQASLTYTYTNILSLMTICETNMSRGEIVEAERLAAVFVPQKETPESKPNPEDLTTKFSPTASGTGFFVTDDGFLVTCAHVVKGATQIRVSTSEGSIDAKIASVDAADDLALLKVEIIPQGGAALPIAATGSTATNLITLPINSTNLNSFYRLVYP